MQATHHKLLISYENPGQGFESDPSQLQPFPDIAFSQICAYFAPCNGVIKLKCGSYDGTFLIQKSGYSLYRGFFQVLKLLKNETTSDLAYTDAVSWDRNQELYSCFLLGEIVIESPAFIFVIKDEQVKFYTRTLFIREPGMLQIQPGIDIPEPYILSMDELISEITNFLKSYLIDISKAFDRITELESYKKQAAYFSI